MPRRRVHARWFAPCLALLLPACGASSSSGEGAGVGAGGSDGMGACAADGTAQTFTPGMTVVGTNGQIKVSLESISPTPLGKEPSEWKLRVTDASDHPLDGMTVVPKGYMPVHKHGTSITPVVTAMGDGSYDVTSLVLFMPGLWQVTIAVSGPSVADSAVFSFCITG